eukprot:Nitzschia sp. Nitz4//scaffold10_size219509//211459//212942//NITZ4_001467-RA/size219509-processed-gene-0.105-mRNA-1//1//CDS//3329533037//5998//frame0
MQFLGIPSPHRTHSAARQSNTLGGENVHSRLMSQDEVASMDGVKDASQTTEPGTPESSFHVESEPCLSESDNNSVVDVKHYLGVLPLAMIAFYNVSGGPFGMEASVLASGFAPAILGFIVMPLVWSVPEAMVTAELGSAFPEASGGVAWVEEAFGSLAGWQAGYLGWVAGATDNAIYPVLFLDYLFQVWQWESIEDSDPFVRFILTSVLTIFLGYLNWLGLDVVGNMAIVIGILSISPFIAMCLIGLPQLDTSRWFQWPEVPDAGDQESTSFFALLTSGAILWRPFLNNLFWNLNSFDSTASYAADVRDPGHTLPRSLLLAVIFVVMGYLFPLLVAIGSTSSEPADWSDGYLAAAATEIGGKWLGGWVVFAAAIANIALFQAELSADAFQVMGMAERGFLPSFFAVRSSRGTPTFGIILGVAVIVAMGSIELEGLIEMLNFNYATALLLEFAAFIKLRMARPDGTYDDHLL